MKYAASLQISKHLMLLIVSSTQFIYCPLKIVSEFRIDGFPIHSAD